MNKILRQLQFEQQCVASIEKLFSLFFLPFPELVEDVEGTLHPLPGFLALRILHGIPEHVRYSIEDFRSHEGASDELDDPGCHLPIPHKPLQSGEDSGSFIQIVLPFLISHASEG